MGIVGDNMLNKKILFFSPEFFGIEKDIVRALKEDGCYVFWADERSIRTSFARALNSVFPCIFYNHAKKYYKKILNQIPIVPDVILIVKGDMVYEDTIKLMRIKFPNAEIILYLWDSVDNVIGILKRVHLYDRVLSFDPEDCKKYDFEHRALFCDFEKDFQNKKQETIHDLCFYGTMYGDRFKVINKLSKICRDNQLDFYKFCFLRGRFMKLFYWITDSSYRKFNRNDLSFEPKSASELSRVVESSRVILDINARNQSGLTLRTLESVVSKKRIITTNPVIKEYDFYNVNNILVINRDNINIPMTFFRSEYSEIDEKILEKYTARGWVKDVFSMYCR